MTTLQRIREVLKNNAEYLRGFGFTEVGVFGSYVRGEATPESDVDILLGSDDSEAGIGRGKFVIYDTLSEQLNNVEIDIAIKRMLFPKLREYILEEVEYVVGPPEAMAHNAARKIGVKPQKDYTLYLDQMIDIMAYNIDRFNITTFEEMKQDRLISGGVINCIQNIGEASTRIPESIKEKYAHLEIPWEDMRDMRNQPVLDYAEILPPKIWKIIKEDFPETLPKVQEMRRLEELRMKKVRNREKRNQNGMEGGKVNKLT